MKLRVKPFRQENEMSCGAASLRSILDFFGKKMNEKEIIRAVGGIVTDDGYHGILSIHAAVALHKMGFKVHAYTYNMELLKPEWATIDSNALIEQLKAKKAGLPKSKKTSKSILGSMIYLLENKQNIKLKFPEKEDIIKFLERGLPVIITVWAKTIYGNSDPLATGGHYLLVNGYDGKNFSVIDPYDGKKMAIEEDRLILAWANNALDSTDYLLAIEPAK